MADCLKYYDDVNKYYVGVYGNVLNSVSMMPISETQKNIIKLIERRDFVIRDVEKIDYSVFLSNFANNKFHATPPIKAIKPHTIIKTLGCLGGDNLVTSEREWLKHCTAALFGVKIDPMNPSKTWDKLANKWSVEAFFPEAKRASEIFGRGYCYFQTKTAAFDFKLDHVYKGKKTTERKYTSAEFDSYHRRRHALNISYLRSQINASSVARVCEDAVTIFARDLKIMGANYVEHTNEK
jgi:hypothetical protein